MKRLLTLIGIFVLLCGSASAQLYFEDTLPPAPKLDVPDVKVNDRAVMFQAGLYPEFYKTRSAHNDLRWVRNNDSALTDFWATKGDSTLLILSELSGLEWVENGFDIFFLRYYPSIGNSDPLILPLGGLRRGMLTTAAPDGTVMQLNLIYHLAQRMLSQADRSDAPYPQSLAGHPLMQPTPYRRDNLALLLTLVAAQQIIGLDSTFEAYQSAFWKQHTPGRQVFEKYLLSDWILTNEQPLARWVAEEPRNSQLVRLTRAPRRPTVASTTRRKSWVEGLPMKGRLGFSVRVSDNNRLTVDLIDSTRLAFASGLRPDDIIRSVDGRRLRTHKQMVEYIMAGLDEGGATLSITREGQSETVLIQPMALYFEDDVIWDSVLDTMYWERVPTGDSVTDSIVDSVSDRGSGTQPTLPDDIEP